MYTTRNLLFKCKEQGRQICTQKPLHTLALICTEFTLLTEPFHAILCYSCLKPGAVPQKRPIKVRDTSHLFPNIPFFTELKKKLYLGANEWRRGPYPLIFEKKKNLGFAQKNNTHQALRDFSVEF